MPFGKREGRGGGSGGEEKEGGGRVRTVQFEVKCLERLLLSLFDFS